MSTTLFDRLVEHATSQGEVVENASKGRFIKRQDDDDAELMARADATALVVTRQIRLIRIEYAESLYFCVLGLPEIENL
jgi:hypothetical protein